jgi:hypothetical protein
MTAMPRIKQSRDGHVFITVKTKGGPRARQVTHRGILWLREKYPADAFPSVEDIPLTYEGYRQMRGLGHIGFKENSLLSQRPSRPAPAPPTSEPSGARQIQATHTVRCLGCGSQAPQSAHFCPRCGRASGHQPNNSAAYGVVAIVAIVAAFVIWRLVTA